MPSSIKKEAAVALTSLSVLIMLAVIVFRGASPPTAPKLSPEQAEKALQDLDIARLNGMMESRRILIEAGQMTQEKAEAEMRLELLKVREEWRFRRGLQNK